VLPLEFQLETLLESAREELATAKPEQFKIFLLDAMAGLRRNEIDKLPWSALRFDEGVIRIRATEYVAVIGPVVHEVSDEFDLYWNHLASIPIAALSRRTTTPEEFVAKRAAFTAFNTTAEHSAYAERVRDSEFARQLKSHAV
jgi:phosphatidylserine/phosphatidylglycerophosphate/cardiolipin synthase-like enzyme